MRKQLSDLRKVMCENGVAWYLVPTDDYHSSEYVGEYFKCRKYLTGFTGSAGTALVGENWAGLWTDGRYFLQATQQLKDSGFSLMKMGEPNVPKLMDYLADHLQAGDVLAYDGRTVTAKEHLRMVKVAAEHGASVRTDLDLVGSIWTDRPALSAEPVFELDTAFTGRSRADKLADLRVSLADADADAIILANLSDICWLTNLRGNDVACTPVVLSFMLVEKTKATLFINSTVLSDEIRGHLAADGITLAPYTAVEDAIRMLPDSTVLMLDRGAVNSAIHNAVPKGVRIVDRVSPTVLPRGIKNATEVANFRIAHICDGVAVTRFMYWLKQNIGKAAMTELSVAEKLEEFRREQPHYLEPSFSPIMGYGPHGAVIHYGATEESNAKLEPRSFLLADTGGHYLEGTTDITRTFALGPLTDEEKAMYTLVLRSHLRLGAARFRHGCTGLNLDILARGPFWDVGMDYNHGTGHGVGYVLSVHEGPHGFRWRAADFRQAQVLEPGMVTSDEPGIYLEGKFGVRLENLTVVCETETNAYGRFLHLEYLTMVPFDLDAINADQLTAEERQLLNAYHKQVFDTISPLLNREEAEWLRTATRAI